MAVESEVIIGKLQSEGIDDKLAAGISFENEEALNAWVGNAKTLLEKPKDISQYTVEELREKADKGEFKNIQSLLDKIRQEGKGKTEPPKTEPNKELEELKAQFLTMQKSIQQANEQSEQAKRNALIDAKCAGLDPFEASLLKNSIAKDATEADIEKTVSDYKALMVKRGLKGYGSATPSNKGGIPSDLSSAIKDFVAEKKKKK